MSTIKKSIPLFILLFISNTLFAGLPNSGFGGRSSALGNACITHSDFWAQFNNQAGLANNNKIRVGSYYENRFMTQALSVKTMGILIPVKKGSFGLNLTHFGESNYYEMNIGLAYGRKLSESLSVGLQFDYFSIHQGQDYGSKDKITFEGGFIYHVDEKIKIGGHLYNPLIKSKNDQDLELPEIYRLGLEYKISKDLNGFFEARNQSDYGSSLHFGLEYLFNCFSFRAGYASKPDIFTFGVGIEQKHFQLDFSSSLHSVLGYSPQVSLVYVF